MQTITIRNRELHRLYIISGILVSSIVILFSQVISNWFYLGILLVIVLIINTSGVQFDATKKKYRKYRHLCFYTWGEWKNIGKNKNLVILVKHGVQTTTGSMMTSTLNTKGGFSELYLMDENHTRRFFINSSENHSKIESLANDLSELLEIEIKPYIPRRNVS